MRLERKGHPILVESKAYAVMVKLLEQPGAMIDKNALLDTVWSIAISRQGYSSG